MAIGRSFTKEFAAAFCGEVVVFVWGEIRNRAQRDVETSPFDCAQDDTVKPCFLPFGPRVSTFKTNRSKDRFRAGYKMPPHDIPLVATGEGVNLSARADGNEQR